MTDGVQLEPVDVGRAIRALIRKDTERVNDPHFIPEDRIGWHAYKPLPDEDRPGAPSYEPESWRWFDLVDVGFVDDMVLISFRWTDPSTPDLRYLVLLPADGLPDADAVAAIVRGQLRTVLKPGWRDRVEKRWLSNSVVLVWRTTDIDTRDQALRERLTARRRTAREALWTTPRDAGA